ncbi:hypothetical protein B0H13DRAFT_1866320 [Mycena leptocephala]|nr:hypothetical protein B0H13DRAFT_1866320 [Mycena leptocephala]
MRAALFLCLAVLLTSPVHGVLTNHTIDDAGPFVQYLPSREGICVGCVDPGANYDVTQLFNGTVTRVAGVNVSIVMNFTGISLYVFFAGPARTEGYHETCHFVLDGSSEISVGVYGPEFAYNSLVYQHTGLEPDSEHILTIQTNTLDGGEIDLDYIVFTQVISLRPRRIVSDLPCLACSSDDPETTTSPVPAPTSSTASIGMSSTATSSSPASTTATSVTDSLVPNSTSVTAFITRRKSRVGAIAGGLVGGVVALLALAALLFFCLPARGKLCGPAAEKAPPASTPAQEFHAEDLFFDAALEADPRVLAVRVQRLTAEVERLKVERLAMDRPDARSSVASDTTATSRAVYGPARSISTLKRDQTRAVRDHQYGYSGSSVRDSLVHTESGLRLTAEAVDEVPPTYEAR